MLRVTVELVPHGDESRAEVIRSVVIAQTERLDDDPDGWRRYSVWDNARTADDIRGRTRDALWTHRRSDGASVLSGQVLASLPCPEVGRVP